jgi:hypothetical protein
VDTLLCIHGDGRPVFGTAVEHHWSSLTRDGAVKVRPPMIETAALPASSGAKNSFESCARVTPSP